MQISSTFFHKIPLEQTFTVVILEDINIYTSKMNHMSFMNSSRLNVAKKYNGKLSANSESEQVHSIKMSSSTFKLLTFINYHTQHSEKLINLYRVIMKL